MNNRIEQAPPSPNSRLVVSCMFVVVFCFCFSFYFCFLDVAPFFLSGYGDIYCQTVLGKCFIMITILGGLVRIVLSFFTNFVKTCTPSMFLGYDFALVIIVHN